MMKNKRKGELSITSLLLAFVLMSVTFSLLAYFITDASTGTGMSPPNVRALNKTSAIQQTINSTRTAVFSSEIGIIDATFAVAKAAWNAIKIPGEMIDTVTDLGAQINGPEYFNGLLNSEIFDAIVMIITVIVITAIMAAVFRVGRV